MGLREIPCEGIGDHRCVRLDRAHSIKRCILAEIWLRVDLVPGRSGVVRSSRDVASDSLSTGFHDRIGIGCARYALVFQVPDYRNNANVG